jgi:hypothetical protein
VTVIAETLLAEAWRGLGGPAAALDAVAFDGPAVVLSSRLATTALLQAAAAAAGAAAAELAAERGAAWDGPAVVVDSRRAAVAGTSERHLRVDGEAPVLFAPLSRFFPAADGWVRTHGNYPHHRDRLLAALGATRDEDVAPAIAALPAATVEARIAAAGGIGAAVRDEVAWRIGIPGAAVSSLPLLSLRRTRSAPVRTWPALPAGPLLPAAGVRVLDLTRVIGGPVATRTLALLGADVLRIDSPHLPELPAQHLDTGFGKRSALLDLDDAADRGRLQELVDTADVVITGYRPGALDRFGLASDALVRGRPGIVVASLSAWGLAGRWWNRRGFDSVVQAATGIALVEGGPDAPGALPAQALDHATGLLLAAAVLRALTEQARGGGTWNAELSLAQTAGWLLLRPPGEDVAAPETLDPEPWLRTTASAAGTLTYAPPPFLLQGGPDDWSTPPVPWGSSDAAWA